MLKMHEPKEWHYERSVYQVGPPVGSYYNVIYVISRSKVIPDCDTKVTTTGDMTCGKWILLMVHCIVG